MKIRSDIKSNDSTRQMAIEDVFSQTSEPDQLMDEKIIEK
jgi:hypothetical protein